MKRRIGLLAAIALVAVGVVLYVGGAMQREAGAVSSSSELESTARTGAELPLPSTEEQAASSSRKAEGVIAVDAERARSGDLKAPMLVVTDAAGSPVAGARARRLPVGVGDLIVTNSRGRALLPEAFAQPSCEFEVAADGFQSETLIAGSSEGGEIRVVLHVRPTIVGHVVDADDQPVAGAIVHAIPREVVASLDEAPASTEDSLGIHLAETDLEGGFRIHADPGVSYELVASLPGRLSREGAHGVQVGDAAVTLVLLPVYGLAIRLLGPDGSPPEHLGARGPIAGQTRSEDPVAKPLRHSPAQLYAIRYWSQSPPLPSDTIVRLFTTQRPRASVGPVRFSRDFAGYESVDLELEAAPSAGGLTQATIQLEPTSPEFGEVEVRFEGDHGRLAVSSSPGAKIGKLMLRPLGGGDTLRYMLDWPRDGSSLLGGVPLGDYEYTFRSKVGGFRYPSGSPSGSPSGNPSGRNGAVGRVTVSSARSAVTIDCAKSGGVIFECPGNAADTIQLSLGRLAQDAGSVETLEQVQVLGTEYFHVTGAVMDVPLVSPGDYLIYIEHPG